MRQPEQRTPRTHREPLPARFARWATDWTGSTPAFFLAVGVIVLWLVTGPLFGFSDTWQLVINTGTTIVTFLMVFLIQNTQNRDSAAIQLKLDELLRAVHRQTQLHKPETEVELQAGAPATVLGSADALQELFLILVDNGLKYTPAGGQVTIGLDRDGGWYAAHVRDTGVGIDPEDLPHVFERFYRATRDRQATGTGLGLAIAKRYIEQNGGRLEIASRRGAGTVVRVRLPAAAPAPSGTAATVV